MRIKRLMAVGIAGILMAASISTDSVPVYATAEEDVIEFVDSDEPVAEEGEEDSGEMYLEEDSDEGLDELEEDSEEGDSAKDLYDDEIESDDLLLGGNAEEVEELEEIDDIYYAMNFYPGEGKVISNLAFGKDISDWEYDAESGVMTAYVPATVKVVQSVRYSLIVPDGSKEFTGWYLDEGHKEKADFSQGVTVESDLDLYAGFRNTGEAPEEFIVSDSVSIDEAAIDKAAMDWPEELVSAEITPESLAADVAEAVADVATEAPEAAADIAEPADEEPIAMADAAVPEKEHLYLEDAKLSRQIPAQIYSENGGVPKPAGSDVIDLFRQGDITVTVDGNKLVFVDDGNASSINMEGYYFTVEDPAESDAKVNRYVGSNNYVTLVPTEAPKYNLVEGKIDVPFEIRGTELSVKNVNSTLYYDGAPVLVYTGGDNNGDGYPDVDTNATLSRIGGVITDSNNEVLSSDRYTITAANDSANIGTVLVVFEGKADRGVTGRITQNIKIVRREIAAADVTVSFADKNLNASSVPMVNGQATPAVTVRLSSSGNELVKDRDYSVIYSDNNAAGKTAAVGIKFAGNYTGTLSKVLTFTVAKDILSKDSIVASAPDKGYSIFARSGYFKSIPVLTYGGKTLKLNTDYVYVEQPTYYYANDVVKKNIFGRVTLSRKAGQKIPDNESVPSGAVINCKFSVVPSSASQAYTANKDKSGKYIPISFTVTYKMR